MSRDKRYIRKRERHKEEDFVHQFEFGFMRKSTKSELRWRSIRRRGRPYSPLVQGGVRPCKRNFIWHGYGVAGRPGQLYRLVKDHRSGDTEDPRRSIVGGWCGSLTPAASFIIAKRAPRVREPVFVCIYLLYISVTLLFTIKSVKQTLASYCLTSAQPCNLHEEYLMASS